VAHKQAQRGVVRMKISALPLYVSITANNSQTEVNIATRLMGLLLAAVAVTIFTSGLLVLLPGLV